MKLFILAHLLSTYYRPGFRHEAPLSGRCRFDHTSFLTRCFRLVRHTCAPRFSPDLLFQIMAMDGSSFLLFLRWQSFHLDMKLHENDNIKSEIVLRYWDLLDYSTIKGSLIGLTFTFFKKLYCIYLWWESITACMCNQMLTSRSQFSPSTVWVSETELRASDLVTSAFVMSHPANSWMFFQHHWPDPKRFICENMLMHAYSICLLWPCML